VLQALKHTPNATRRTDATTETGVGVVHVAELGREVFSGCLAVQTSGMHGCTFAQAGLKRGRERKHVQRAKTMKGG